MSSLLRFHKPGSDESLPPHALALNSAEKKAYKAAVQASPDELCPISVYDRGMASPAECRAAFDCIRRSDSARDAWVVSFQDVEALLREKLPEDVFSWVRYEPEDVECEDCAHLSGCAAHCALFGVAKHKANSARIREWVPVIQTYVARLFVRERAR